MHVQRLHQSNQLILSQTLTVTVSEETETALNNRQTTAVGCNMQLQARHNRGFNLIGNPKRAFSL
jgi:hypothetical protein